MSSDGWVFLFLVGFLLFMWWAQRHPTEPSEIMRLAEQRKAYLKNPPPLSEVGQSASGTLACPVCGGTQFKARRSGRGRAGIVAGGFVAAAMIPQDRVQCVTCGEIFRRG